MLINLNVSAASDMIAALVVFVSVYLAIRAIMVELLQNLQDIYTKWENKARPQMHLLKSSTNNKHIDSWNAWSSQNNRVTFSNYNHRNHKLSLSATKWKNLAQFKMSPSVIPKNLLMRPFVGRCCSQCLPISRNAFVDDSLLTLSVKNMLHIPSSSSRFIPTKFIKSAVYLLCQPMPHEYADVSESVLNSESIYQAIESAVHEEVQGETEETDVTELKDQQTKRARSILTIMKAALSTVLLRLAVWLMNRLMSRMLSGVLVHKGQLEILKRLSKNNKAPIIYLPLHRSHLDYILVTYILYLNNMRIPLVAAGDNLRIPFFGTLLRGLGGFFIKRKLDFRNGQKDYVYRAILQSYMTEVLKAGHSMEFFLEGGRSRTGKACLPKGGLLSVVVNSLVDGLLEDAYIVPISISYEKLLEGNFISEQLGQPKTMESFSAAVVSIWKILHSNYGSVRVDFCQPFSLKEFLYSSKKFPIDAPLYQSPPPLVRYTKVPFTRKYRSSSSNSLFSNDSSEDHRQTIRDLADHVVYESSNTLALMSTNLVAFMFLTKHRKGATLQQLAQSLNWLREEITARKHQMGFTGESVDVIKYACNLLGKNMVRSETIQMEWSSGDMENNNLKIVFYRPVVKLPDVLELQYYSNSVVSVFLMESIVVNALFAIIGEDIEALRSCDSRVLLMRQDLMKKAHALCNILQFEFIFSPPCTPVSSVITDAIDRLISSEMVSVNRITSCQSRIQEYSESTGYGYRLEDSSEEEDDAFPVHQDHELKVKLTEESIHFLQFLRCILGSYIESYWIVACSLANLVNEQKEEKSFFKEIQKTAQDRLHQGLLCYEESFAADTLRNALRLFEHWEVLETYNHDGIRLVYLGESWNSEDAVNEIIARIEEFRR